ncbi:oxaloacetate decarboxylase subunit gamma [Photobacterium profundum]|uniref:Probable oxaloacetate decarboxylase gamma chain n=1 Tax=Photobacterium profundum 3TCK TaxID=314280 RepID=Q1YWF6_9GAMM|nr:oxaloacetate decarboxylase subunit gamma [Photobacterium profundum]EAS40586.1 putative oxaloacetate decarboxylase subunit gamma [Photobacterium profundum 3TCK]PSV59946.1 oxaloacetate decarboxylase subunit gamma [Photobacterium profundum]
MADLGSLLQEAATIMLTGMFVVFGFLSVLIYLVQLLSKLAPADAVSIPKPMTNVESNHAGVQPDVVAAISAAVHLYRQRNA